jgi:hypothetical protein
VKFKEGDLIFNTKLNKIFKYLRLASESDESCWNSKNGQLKAENIMGYKNYVPQVFLIIENCVLATQEQIANAIAEKMTD